MKPSDRGFTLVEALFSVVILAVCIASVIPILPEGYRRIAVSGRVSTINHLAQGKIDELKAKGFSHSDLTSGAHPASASQRPVTGFPGYSRTWNVTNNSPITNIKTIAITVGYRLHDAAGALLPAGTPGQMSSTFQFMATQ